MKKGISLLLVLVLSITLIGCGNTKKEEKIIIEYGTDFSLKKHVKLKDGESVESDQQIDTKQVGSYFLNISIKKDGKQVRSEEKVIVVEDSKPAKIKTVQSTDKIYEIALKDNYDPLANIDVMKDGVDGEYSEIVKVDEKQYKKILKDVEKARKEINNLEFRENKKDKYKKEVKSGYGILLSNVDSNKVGTYEVKVACIDTNYNVSKVSYKIKVVKEADKIKKENLAVGIKKEEEKKEKEQPTSNAPVKSVEEFTNTIVSGNAGVSSNGIVQAAMNLRGKSMSCDELVTTALVNSGMITGSAASIFHTANGYTVGMPGIAVIATPVSSPQPGDIIYYDNGGLGYSHVAIYAGNNMAVHGGYNGMNVVLATAWLGSGYHYYRPIKITWDQVYSNMFGSNPNDWGTSSGGNDDSGSSKPPQDIKQWITGVNIATSQGMQEGIYDEFKITITYTNTSGTSVSETYIAYNISMDVSTQAENYIHSLWEYDATVSSTLASYGFKRM